MTVEKIELVQKSIKGLDRERLPQHIAIIMDGNRRWAREKRLPVFAGHRAGAEALRRTIEACVEIGIKVLTVYAFSKENWSRAEEEVKILFYLFEYFIKKERVALNENGIRFQVIGRIDELSPQLQEEFQKTVDLTRNNDKLIFNLAVNYGARTEFIDAVRAIIEKVKRGELAPYMIDDEVISSHLYTHGLPDPDLLIRTSGEQRISNFLLWQIAYSELWFTSSYWPDFGKEELLKAISDYQKRVRRFGGN